MPCHCHAMPLHGSKPLSSRVFDGAFCGAVVPQYRRLQLFTSSVLVWARIPVSARPAAAFVRVSRAGSRVVFGRQGDSRQEGPPRRALCVPPLCSLSSITSCACVRRCIFLAFPLSLVVRRHGRSYLSRACSLCKSCDLLRIHQIPRVETCRIAFTLFWMRSVTREPDSRVPGQ